MSDFNKLAEHQPSTVLDAIVASGFSSSQQNREQKEKEDAHNKQPEWLKCL